MTQVLSIWFRGPLGRVTLLLAAVMGSWFWVTPVRAQATSPLLTLHVRDSSQWRQALKRAVPGTTILLEPGRYRGDVEGRNLRGEPGRPIVIRAADPQRLPVIDGGGEGLHLIGVAHVVLMDLIFENARDNGLNIDDGGQHAAPSHHITLNNITVRHVGGRGNHDGIKLSGVNDFNVDGVLVDSWGDGGSAIDMVGCHRGLIQNSVFRHHEAGGATGLQAKGGSRLIAIRNNRFEHAGARAIQLGGNTGLGFFRPSPQGYEAKEISVEGNTIIGSEAPISFVNVDGSEVRYNTIYLPGKYVLRILQENNAPGFVPSRNGVFRDNIVVFRLADLPQGAVNIGPNTAPQTFQFARNWWYCLDQPGKSRPTLPSEEIDGRYGVDPQLADPDAGRLHLKPDSPAAAYGAHASRPQTMPSQP